MISERGAVWLIAMCTTVEVKSRTPAREWFDLRSLTLYVAVSERKNFFYRLGKSLNKNRRKAVFLSLA